MSNSLITSKYELTQEPLIFSLTLQAMPSYDFCKELEHLKKIDLFFYEKMLSLCSRQTSKMTPFSNNRRHVQSRLETIGGPRQNLNEGPLKANFIRQHLIIPLGIECFLPKNTND